MGNIEMGNNDERYREGGSAMVDTEMGALQREISRRRNSNGDIEMGVL